MSNISILNLLYYVETLSGVNNYDYTQAFLYVMVLSECEGLTYAIWECGICIFVSKTPSISCCWTTKLITVGPSCVFIPMVTSRGTS